MGLDGILVRHGLEGSMVHGWHIKSTNNHCPEGLLSLGVGVRELAFTKNFVTPTPNAGSYHSHLIVIGALFLVLGLPKSSWMFGS